jgi:DNA-directed RNA polymerase omega subunit
MARVSGSNGERAAYLDNRFHLLSLAFQRAHQLNAGARPRVPRRDHKPTRLALLEVMADTVSWSLETEVATAESRTGEAVSTPLEP